MSVAKLILLHYITNLASSNTFSEMSSHKSTSTTGGDYSNKGLEPSLKEKSGMQCFE